MPCRHHEVYNLYLHNQTNSYEHIPIQETESFSAAQNIWHILRDPCVCLYDAAPPL